MDIASARSRAPLPEDVVQRVLNCSADEDGNDEDDEGEPIDWEFLSRDDKGEDGAECSRALVTLRPRMSPHRRMVR